MTSGCVAGADNHSLTPAEVLGRYAPHDGSIASFLAARCRVGGGDSALVFEQREWTYSEVEQAAVLLAATLAGRGLAAGDRLVLFSLNTDLSLILFLAVARLGALFIPLNPGATQEELRYLLRHARPALIVSQSADSERVRQLAGELEHVPQLTGLDEFGLRAQTPAEVLAELGRVAGAARAASPAKADDAAVVIYTSGTTGFPKGVVHTQRTFVLAAEGFVERMHLQPSDRLLAVMPFFHINALFYSFGGALAAGAALVTTRRFSASQFWHLAAATRSTEFNFLAAIGNILMNRPRSEFNPQHRIRKVYGGPISERMYRVFAEEFAVPELIEGYGMTEIPGACCNPFLGLRKPGSIGRPAVHPFVAGEFAELRVVDDDGGELPLGAVGELVVRTPMMFREYLDDPQQTAAAFRDGWFLTGDLARRDEDGYFHFVARKKDIIRRRGENISGAELDRIVGDHPQVAEAAAIGVPSELGEEEILLVVVPKAAGGLRAEDLLEWCRIRMSSMKVPRYIVFTDLLPHTPSHRVAKHRLKADRTLLERAFDAEREPGV
jgi:crotonobetaine/carnitine-CoA ligase